MNLKYLSVLCVFLAGLAISQPQIKNLQGEYNKGLSYFNQENPTDETDNKAVESFLKVAEITPKNYAEAKLLSSALEKLGVLYQTKEQNQKAKKYYKNSLSVAQKYQLIDSLSFPSLLYVSGLYYYESAYDSCLFYLSKAEKILDKYPKIPEAERLYNTKGVLLFEAGNFRQSLAYFKKAGFLTNAVEFANKNNQALALQFLNQPDSTFKILKQLEVKFPDDYQIKINLASVLIEMNQAQKALSYLKKNYGDSVVFYNTLGKAFFKLNELKKAKMFFQTSVSLAKTKNPNLGFAHYYLGKIAAKSGYNFQALSHFQNALQNLDFFFNQKNIYLNPIYNSDGFYSFFILEILGEKAEVFGQLYLKTKELRYLRGATGTYEAFSLIASNISKTYNQEDARLDIVDDIHPKYQSFTKILWMAYKNTNDQQYAKRAFEVSEESKATVLSLSINESQIKRSSDVPDSLIKAEQNLQISLAALRKNIENSTEKQQVNQYLAAIYETEIKLGKLNEKLEKFPAYKARKFRENQKLKIEKLRGFLANNEVLISYCDLGEKALLFCITKSDFRIHELTDKQLLETEIKKMKVDFNTSRFQKEAKTVFQFLFKPFQEIIKKKSHIIFVGDGLTNGLPTEYLINEENRYLVENHAVSYLFSAQFILSSKEPVAVRNILAFAPFSAPKFRKDFLPNSLKEIQEIEGANVLEDIKATKQAFFENANKYQIIHLATHAIANVTAPEKSFVRFSGGLDDKLYLFEFSAGMLKNTQLVFLSACDSYGNTNLQGEGIRGLSRGFYLAGSQSIISSLWKAEDFATAYLSKHFYEHLSEGTEFSEALQMAKVDLLNDPMMVQFRHPMYWSHLIYVGYQKNKTYEYGNILMFTLLFLLMAFVILLIKKGVLLKPKS
ncbi:CHAT domain-containing protein [Lacihabitans sp. LS3-19]|uniref:CHAT domain-containing protein n=1 Tax=Lacihabitans sp. LS3-19 TaxID=2487335 RepID=UPI0020CC187C|nr:CHAT domain-containing protein [Lacihabitans sp. LS3-19]MCP9768445.1 CHAT domain-containing protein [Lacihabitans sp. LS3-19]